MPNDSGANRAPCLVTCGNYILTFTGLGETIEEARKAAYGFYKKKIRLINSPMYRDDIGEKVIEMLPELKKHGYAVGVK
jgi:phosphoribosylamine-glycine ligase